jgi:histidinol phosphatase-like enzyme (inositol monophosphatase family)
MKELQVALKAAKESNKILNYYFTKKLRVYTKTDQSPVTNADKTSEKKIVAVIKKHFPDHNILGEEFSYKKTDSEFKWIIDPLDMTKNFIRGIPFFSNFIALEKNSKIVVGVISMPAMGILAYAESGKGTFINGKRVKTSDTNDISKAFVVFGDIDNKGLTPYNEQFHDLINTCAYNRGYGDALGYILLAQGMVDIVFDRPKPWDIASGKIIVEEAGGTITDFEGRDTIYSGSSIATNGKLHDDVIKILKSKQIK